MEPHPHCLSRDFHPRGYPEGEFDGRNLSSKSVSRLLTAERYDFFVKDLEEGLHDAVPMGIYGDFAYFTAPNGR